MDSEEAPVHYPHTPAALHASFDCKLYFESIESKRHHRLRICVFSLTLCTVIKALRFSIRFLNCRLRDLSCMFRALNCRLRALHCLRTLSCRLRSLNCRLRALSCRLKALNCLRTLRCRLRSLNCRFRAFSCRSVSYGQQLFQPLSSRGQTLSSQMEALVFMAMCCSRGCSPSWLSCEEPTACCRRPSRKWTAARPPTRPR